MLWGKVSVYCTDGDISEVSDQELERWAQWTGEPGAFAEFVRARHVTDGRINDWDEFQGALEERRAKERERKRRERAAAKSETYAGRTQDSPPDVRTKSAPTITITNTKELHPRRKSARPDARLATVPEATRTKGPRGTTWLTPYQDAWEQVNGAGSFTALFGQAAKSLRPLHEAHGTTAVARHLTNYLHQTEARYQSLSKFASTFAQWAKLPPLPDDLALARDASTPEGQAILDERSAGRYEVPTRVR
jgi:hypothetical protein